MKNLVNYDYVPDRVRKDFSQYLSFILRHYPEDIGLELMEDGWLSVDDMLTNMMNYGKWCVGLEFLKKIVENDNKGRYSFKDDYKYIRANQGHSIKGLIFHYDEYQGNGVLYHGTADRFLPSIEKDGLLPMNRNSIHLSKDYMTAVNVAKRHVKKGEPFIVFSIGYEDMVRDGYKFYESENGVVLVEKAIPYKYLHIHTRTI